ncbi:ABC transporter substrate-binding protein [Flavonifractor sp. DFI.6.63]|uniref:ABC transporter substrate-binding protein n=1 Tax=Lawsonibacter hominis TaxID=2763053 RepID=A0A8J6J333_9FIRM|nr:MULTISPECIES: ABC transporter substrate-binding protein [Oscillospiraceae]MBC5732898.1 ABC transporter substrate-binding protein [Lawsonibacter hominis]MBS1382791.1 ABC transporter substrate-binding protein [Flavonifractor sp.]MCQ5028446.1 ABC transporter substrate-binding protein [Flavonifractor sp. DFI.6.63]MDU2195531.1 ABC transporter substrate-binding protein [Clostridiales bacterium]
MKKSRILSLAMAGALCFSLLAGCGGSGGTASSPAPETTSPETGAPESTAPAGGSTSAFKLGGTGPLTGGAAIYGNAAKQGAEIAVEEINALNGDIRFDLRYEDDAHDAEKAGNAYNTLKDWGLQIFLGSVTSTPCVATSSESNADHIFLLTPSASSTDVLGGVADPLTGTVNIPRKDNAFQMCFMDPNQGSASAQYISDKTLGEKIAVIYKNDDVYSTGIYNSFVAKAAELGLEIVSTTTFTEDSQTDFSVQIADAKTNGADLIFLPMYYTPASLILAQAKAVGYAPTFFGVDGMDGILTLDGFDTALAEGVMLLTPFNADAEDDATRSFVTKYQEKYGDIPNQFAADAYDCVYAIYQALTNAGATSDMSASELCDLLIAQFTSPEFSFDGLTGEGMTWDETGAVSKSPKGMVIANGAYVGMD